MTLQKNLLGLVFLFLLNSMFSQEKQLGITNETQKEYVFPEKTDFYINNKANVRISKTITHHQQTEIKVDNFFSKEFDSTITKVSANFMVETLPINSKNSDYAPSYYNGELVFASSRSTKSLSVILQGDTNEPFLDLYTTVKQGNSKRNISKLKGRINTKLHESSAVFSKDGKTVYFTRNNYSRGKFKRNAEGYVLLKLYKAEYINEKWKNVEELPFNSDEYSIAHPALSPDGKFLYFASNMPGSYGKSDIFKVEILEKGSYSTPQNLGSSINSSGRETFPFISDTGTLFFASDGHQGLGGLDIFRVQEDKDMKVYNMGAPINSPKDDFTFIINEENNTGYFASNRDGGKGGDDIYGFKQITSPLKPTVPKTKKRIKKHMKLMPMPKKENITSF